MIIAIDGPAGSGKTTVAKLLAKKLGIFYLDTGATYRALTYAALEKKMDLSDRYVLKELAKNLNLKINGDRIFLGQRDISSEIRTPSIDKNISVVVSFPEVREVMVKLQRKIVKGRNFVVEGRDITTVVFPKSQYKFYLDAAPQIRAQRRFEELKKKGLDISFEEVKEDLEKRDYADKNRKVGPLVVSSDAQYIDTTDLKLEEVVSKIAACIRLDGV